MKKNLAIVVSLVVVITVIVVLITSGVISFNDKSAQTSMDAYLEGLQGDNSELKDLGIDQDVSKIKDDIISGYGFSEAQYNTAIGLYDKTSIKVEEEIAVEEDDEYVDVVYTIEMFPIIDLFIVIMENAEEYGLTEVVEVLGSEDSTQEEIQQSTAELLAKYNEEITKVESVKETYKVRMMRNDKGALEFVEDDNGNLKDLEDLILTVPGVNTNVQYEKGQ